MDINNGVLVFNNNETKVVQEKFYINTEFVNSWLLMDSPIPITIILISYLLFVLKLGPALMKNREPFKFQHLIPLYNAVQVLISCFLAHMCVTMMVKNGVIPKTCNMETETQRLHLTGAMHYYFLAKVSELLDTIFFVLRKKQNQVSFLHVYHHTLMVTVTWLALKYEPTYALLFLGALNSTVHVVMYTYYGLSSYPNIAKYLWWKKYITKMQLIQFVLIMAHFAIAFVKSECTPSYIMAVAMAVNGTLFLYLFGSFYFKTYKKSTNKNKETNTNNEAKKNQHEIDTKIHENGKIINTNNGKIDDVNNYTSTSITVNDKYRIQFNLSTKKSI